jgi:hypothetical protein
VPIETSEGKNYAEVNGNDILKLESQESVDQVVSVFSEPGLHSLADGYSDFMARIEMLQTFYFQQV